MPSPEPETIRQLVLSGEITPAMGELLEAEYEYRLERQPEIVKMLQGQPDGTLIFRPPRRRNHE